MLAAYQQKFSFTGIEKDEQYYEKSINRFKQATKQLRLF
jgi:DNA modification methylase